MKIQKDLAVAQIKAFSEAIEKVQRVEIARLQVRLPGEEARISWKQLRAGG